MPLQVKRTQVRRVRRAHLASKAESRASSRASAAKALTTALVPIASASIPPTLVSHWLESRAAGASTRVASVTVSAI